MESLPEIHHSCGLVTPFKSYGEAIHPTSRTSHKRATPKHTNTQPTPPPPTHDHDRQQGWVSTRSHLAPYPRTTKNGATMSRKWWEAVPPGLGTTMYGMPAIRRQADPTNCPPWVRKHRYTDQSNTRKFTQSGGKHRNRHRHDEGEGNGARACQRRCSPRPRSGPF